MWRWFVDAVWPNLVASMLWSLPAGGAYVWHQRRRLRHLMDHVTREIGRESSRES